MANKRKCVCCNTKYDYCPSCAADRMKPTWLSTFCSETCKTVWETLSKYSMEFISREEAAEAIQSLDIKDKSQYVECVQRDMEKVFKDETKSRRIATKKAEIPTIDDFSDTENAKVVDAEV